MKTLKLLYPLICLLAIAISCDNNGKADPTPTPTPTPKNPAQIDLIATVTLEQLEFAQQNFTVVMAGKDTLRFSEKDMTTFTDTSRIRELNQRIILMCGLEPPMDYNYDSIRFLSYHLGTLSQGDSVVGLSCKFVPLKPEPKDSTFNYIKAFNLLIGGKGYDNFECSLHKGVYTDSTRLRQFGETIYKHGIPITGTSNTYTY